jgi:subtilisin family serine protease
LEVERRRADVRSEQAPVKLAIEQAGGQVLGSVDTVANAIFVRMPASQAGRLASLPGVKRVYPVREFKLLLDHAVVVHKIVDAWNQIGLDKAGAGIKIAIIDTGIDNAHPAFQDASLAVPKGFPQADTSADKAYTNNKVIVARSYVNLLGSDPDTSARDDVGHGTGVAMAAAGMLNSGPLATIRGVAPVAYLGNYKIFGSPGVNDSTSDDAIIAGIDGAVADGMDVLNLSLGTTVATNLADDPEASAIARATSMGVIVVVAEGNGGPDPQTMGSPATAPSAIAVGAQLNNRTFSASASVAGAAYQAVPGSATAPPQPVTASIRDITSLDSDGLVCSALPSGSLKGDIAFILRGTCLFSDKIANVAAAGAVGVLVYTDQASPTAITMEVGTETLPAMMVSYSDGISIKQQLAGKAKVTATLNFTLQAFSVNPDQLADFSAEGPNVDGSIKPDLVAVGMYVYTAAETTDSQGELYNAQGYVFADGTSYSSPIVAGAVALLKAARPGLTAAEYRSLVINSAAPAFLTPGVPARVQQAGAGSLDMIAALNASGAAAPTSLSFGIGGGDVQQSKALTISNVTNASETFTIYVAGRDAPTGPVPPGSRTADALDTYSIQPIVSVSPSSLTLDAGGSGTVTMTMTGSQLPAAAYEGFVHLVGTKSGVDERVPYWYGVGPGAPAHLTILDTATSPTAGALTQDAIEFRVTDASGINVTGAQPKVTVVDGGGSVLGVISEGIIFPGVFGVEIEFGPTAGNNDFQIQVGSLIQTVTIVTQ